jgi:hypothetical protein
MGRLPSQLARLAHRLHVTAGQLTTAAIRLILRSAARLPTGRQVGLQGGQALHTAGRKKQSASLLQLSSSLTRRWGGSARGVLGWAYAGVASSTVRRSARDMGR